MKNILVLIFLFLSLHVAGEPALYQLKSPDSSLMMQVEAGATVSWTLFVDGVKLCGPNRIGLVLEKSLLPDTGNGKPKARFSGTENTYERPISVKTSRVKDHFNELRLI
jgi:hypothetical protein